MSAMAAAQQNSSPLLILGGRAPAGRWGMGSLQEIEHVPFVAPLTRFAATAPSAEAVSGLIDEALRATVGARSGVAFIDFPMDHVFSVAADRRTPRRADRLARTATGRRRRARAGGRPAGRRAASGDHGGHQRLVGPCRGGAVASGRAATDTGADERHGPRHRARGPPAGFLAGTLKSVGTGRCCRRGGVPMDFRLGFGRGIRPRDPADRGRSLANPTVNIPGRSPPDSTVTSRRS